MYRNKTLLEIARTANTCGICKKHNDGTIVAAHSNQLRDGKGIGLKAHDYRIAALCFTCHAELDQGKNWSREEREQKWEEAHRAFIGWLFENDHIRIL
jgi:hypothetical protein